MTQERIENLRGEGIAIRHDFDEVLSPENYKKLNRLIEIELLLEQDARLNNLDDKMDILTDTMLDGFDRIYDKVVQ